MAPVQNAATVTIVMVQTPRTNTVLAGGERVRDELHGGVSTGEDGCRRHHRDDALEVAGGDGARSRWATETGHESGPRCLPSCTLSPHAPEGVRPLACR